MLAASVFFQYDGEVTKGYYAKLDGLGLRGQLATALFRAQKRSTAAKKYRRSAHRHDAYDVKNWSLAEVVRILPLLDFVWGWKRDERTPGFEWVLYVDLPTGGQCSFRSASRLKGPDYANDWALGDRSLFAILAYCDSVADEPVTVTEELSLRIAAARHEWQTFLRSRRVESTSEQMAFRKDPLMNRPTSCVEILRHNFSDKEKLVMADTLAGAHSRLAELKEKKDAANATFSEEEKKIKLEIGSVSRLYQQGFDMRSIRCRIEYDKPNINEKSIIREDTGEVVKTMPFSETDRQQELPLTNREGQIEVIPPAPAPEKTDEQAAQAVTESAEAVDEFFGNVTCQECEKPFPASVIVKTSEGQNLCPECYAKQPADVQPGDVAVEIPADVDSSDNGVPDSEFADPEVDAQQLNF